MTEAGEVVAQRATWLRQWREATGKMQIECAQAVGISRSRWAEIEAGAAPSHVAALAIEKLTDIAPRDFHQRSTWLPVLKRVSTQRRRRP